MKALNIKLLFAFFSVTVLLSGCKKDENELSRPTFWPNLTIQGDKLVIITVGDSYEDEGAIATVNGEPIEVDTDNGVDSETPGVYSVDYSAYNTDGIPAKDSRTVIVLPDVELADGDVVVGKYKLAVPTRPIPIPEMEVTKIADGLYYTTNIYGSNGSNQLILIPAYIYTTNGINFTVLDASPIASKFAGNIAFDGTATWNPSTNRLACSFYIASVGSGSVFNRTWLHN
ncbi:MAG: hypothetical protein RL222_1546 [Bacteroidota bacterium]|jgi:hypothetical protein